MHEALSAISSELDGLGAAVLSAIPNDQPIGIAHNNWSFPPITRAELAGEASGLASLIRESGGNEVENEPLLKDYVRRIQFLKSQTVGQLWGNANQAISTYLLTLQSLRRALAPSLKPDASSEASTKLRRLTAQLRGMEARLRALDPRSAKLEVMLQRIEGAYQAADQLPTDLEALGEARDSLRRLLEDARVDRAHIETSREVLDDLRDRISESAGNAEAVLDKCQSAYAAATSQGLAAAFSERSQTLERSMWAWVGGLAVALICGGLVGAHQLHGLSELLKGPAASSPLVVVNLILAVLSVGAPIWFAWLATKQVGQRFRLAEDYAFKASVSRAYEGYRREAARIDKDLEAELLKSALARLDELPLRLVETETHGSPWHELLSSEVVRDALRTVPDFATNVLDLAQRGLRRQAVREKVTAAIDETE